MADLHGHEAGNGGYSQGRPTARRVLLYSERCPVAAAFIVQVTDSWSLIRTQLDVQIAVLYACAMETRSAKLDVFLTNGRKGLFAVVSIAKDEILIDLNGEETLSSPTRRSLQIGEGKHAFGREETVGYLNHGCDPNVFLDFSCLCVRALKDIRAGEEVAINYAATEYDMHDSFPCACM